MAGRRPRSASADRNNAIVGALYAGRTRECDGREEGVNVYADCPSILAAKLVEGRYGTSAEAQEDSYLSITPPHRFGERP